MAEIWPVYEGNAPTRGEPWAYLPLKEAASLFELKQGDLVSDLEITPRFGLQDRDLWFAGFKHVVVRINPEEAELTDWKPGYYRSRIRPKEAFARLIGHALIPALGARNVVRIAWEPTVDSQGDAALKIVVVLTPGATRRLKGDDALDASIALRRKLPEIFRDTIPIIEYVTEAELSQSAGH
jgi:hypothetical protein